MQERIIRTPLHKRGLTPLPKYDQISMLEGNAIALFGALSLTYSEVKSPPIWIPRTYLHTYLTGESGLPQLHGFGVALKEVLLPYCHCHFDKVFERAVLHLENTAGIILDNDLLSPEGTNDGTAAFFLGIFLCFNAVSFSINGVDMSAQDYNRDCLSCLPSIPLQGNIKKLMAELRKKIAAMTPPSHRCGFLRAPTTFLDLEPLVTGWKTATCDGSFAVCKLKQLEDKVEVEILDGTHDIRNVYANMDIPFHESADIFEQQYAKNSDFLQRVQDTEEELERKADEQSARRRIAQFIELYSAKKRTRFDAVAALEYFRRWKFTLKMFIIQMKFKLVKTNSTTNADMNQSGEKVRMIFNEMINPLDIRSEVSKQKDVAIQMFHNAIIDGIECTYCSVVHDRQVQKDRYIQWENEGRTVPFVTFTQIYNYQVYHCPNAAHQSYVDHIDHPMHKDKVMKYMHNLEHFATVYARLKIGIDLVANIVYQCDLEGQKGGKHASWYLSTAEEARELWTRLENHQKELWDLGMKWSCQPFLESYQHIWIITQRANELSDLPHSFFEGKKLLEINLKESQLDQASGANGTERDDVGDVFNLVSGRYLNP